MNTQIVFAQTAKSDLRDIAVSLAVLSKDKNLAIRFVKELQEQVKILERFPESGAVPRDRVLKSSDYRFLSYKEYLLFYRYEKSQNKVYIMAVFHGKQDYMRVMKRFL